MMILCRVERKTLTQSSSHVWSIGLTVMVARISSHLTRDVLSTESVSVLLKKLNLKVRPHRGASVSVSASLLKQQATL